MLVQETTWGIISSMMFLKWIWKCIAAWNVLSILTIAHNGRGAQSVKFNDNNVVGELNVEESRAYREVNVPFQLVWCITKKLCMFWWYLEGKWLRTRWWYSTISNYSKIASSRLQLSQANWSAKTCSIPTRSWSWAEIGGMYWNKSALQNPTE